MDESTAVAEAPAAEATAPQAGTPSQVDSGASQAEARETLSLEEAKKLRTEAQSLRKQIRDLEAKNQAHEQSKLSAEERLQARIKELEKTEAEARERLRDLTIRGSLTDAGAKVGAIRPAVLYRLVDTDDLVFADDGSLKNADLLVGNLKRQYPELFRSPAGSADAGSGGAPATPGASMDAYIRKAAGIT